MQSRIKPQFAHKILHFDSKVAKNPHTRHSTDEEGGQGAAEGPFESLMALYYTFESGFFCTPGTNFRYIYSIYTYIEALSGKSTILSAFLYLL